jgi:hypothetical protein
MQSAAPIHTHHHAVQFYGTNQSLYSTVAGFLSEGLIAGQPALIIACEEHRSGILARLTERLIDVEKAQAAGDLVLLDANEVLATFMRDGAPDDAAFEAEVGCIVSRILDERPLRTILRTYGEMVDVLWKDGREDAAIRLEILWNKLTAQFGVALLCGYSMGQFYKQAARFDEVCSHHTAVIETDSNVVPFPRNHVRTA